MYIHVCIYISNTVCDHLVVQVFQVALILDLRTSYVLQESLGYFQQYKTAAKRITCIYNSTINPKDLTFGVKDVLMPFVTYIST